MKDVLRVVAQMGAYCSGAVFSGVSPLAGFITLAVGAFTVLWIQNDDLHDERAKTRRLLDERHYLRMQLFGARIIPEEYGVRAPLPWPRAPRPEGK